MIRQTVTRSPLPEYHEAMLLVKVRPDLERVVTESLRASAEVPRRRGRGIAGGPAALSRAAARPDTFSTPGISALARFERAGLIKRVTPLARPSDHSLTSAGPRRAIRSLALSARATSAHNGLNAGVNLLELESDTNVAELRNALAEDPLVEFVARVPIRYMMLAKKKAKGRAGIQAVPPNASSMWNLRKILWADARGLAGFKDASKVKVAVLDTGIDAKHPDLKGRVSDYSFEHPDTAGLSGEKDIVGHGTHVSGTIAARINNHLGINGICECSLHVKKIFNDTAEFGSYEEGFGYYVDPVMYRRALADCLEDGMDVINLSIGGSGKPDPQEDELFRALLDAGTVVVAAMGNEREYGSPTSYPAAINGVIAVGATTLDDSVAEFSNRGDHITLCAPGKAIWSTLPTYGGQFGFEAVKGPSGKPKEGKALKRERNYDSWDGTSMATPHVTAAAALAIAKLGQIGPEKMKARFKKTCDRVEGMNGKSFHSDFGVGRLNLARLLGA